MKKCSMKRSSIYACAMVGAFILTLVGGGFLFVNKALAAVGDNCPQPTAANYKQCKDCQCKVMLVVPGNKVTQLTIQKVQGCVQTPFCASKPGLNAWADLNGDGFINGLDLSIAKRCLGCIVTPSPFN